MSPFQFPDVPYTIEKIMESIRVQIVEGAAETEPESAHPPNELTPTAPRPLVDTGDPLSQLAAQVDLLRQHQGLDPGYRVRSHRLVLGPLINLVKRVIHWGSRPYTDAIRRRQEAFNDVAVQALREVMIELERARRQIADTRAELHADLRRENAALRQDLQSLQTLIHQVQEEAGRKLFQELEDLGGRLTQLIHDSIQQATRYQEWLVEEKQHYLEGMIADVARKAAEEAEQIRRNHAARLDELARSARALIARHDLGPFFSRVPEDKRLATMATTRGTWEDISGRQAFYVDLLERAPGQVLDVGCGRGELLAQLLHRGVECWGAEIDPLLVRLCRERGLHVVQCDALAALRGAPPQSLGAVFAAQVVEHLFPGELLCFLRLARTRLARGGLLVLETLNPAALAVLAKSYYRDIDHKQPLHPEYMKLLAELAGFEPVELHYLAPFHETERLPDLPPAESLGLSGAARQSLQERFDQLNRILYGMQDYYIVAHQGEPAPVDSRDDDGGAANT
ncbi:MAG TPA: methionine biosynthesis protein MetW [Candidatus Sumerlaeota bacterium]|nr:methionine biosynthesis protein MetW [Candidatus Sumerlaeota bacterium]